MVGNSKTGRAANLPSGAMTPAQALAALQDLFSGEVETPEEGYRTMQQWANEWGLSRERATTLVKRGIDAGKVDTKSYRINTGSKVYKVPHYRINA